MSYTNNPRSILAGSGITITPITGTGAEVVTISSSGVPSLAVRVATTATVAVSATTDDVISVQLTPAATVTVNLPAGTLGKTFTIKDGLGLATAITPINVTPNLVELIDGVNAPAVINAPWGSLTFVYDGTQWIVV